MFNQPLEITMNNTGSLCTNTSLDQVEVRLVTRIWVNATRSLFSRLMRARQPRMSACDLTALDGLSAATLKDIGAPEWVHERAQRSANRAHPGSLFERDSLHWR
jgi:hypothetical protein